MKMGRLALTLALLFLSSAAFSCADDLTAGDLPESAAAILLPTESEDPAGSKLPVAEDVLPADDSVVKVEYEDPAASNLPEENELRTVESNEEVTTVTFRPADHRRDGRAAMPVSFRFPFRHRRPCRHRRRPFNPSDLVAHSRQIPYGNDMIMATKDSKDSQEPIRFHHHRHRHHHHGEPEDEQEGQKFQMKWHSGSAVGDHHDMKKFHRGHPHFEREDDDEKEHDHHHKHHHHHHDEEDDEEEKGGLLIKFRKFLMDRF